MRRTLARRRDRRRTLMEHTSSTTTPWSRMLRSRPRPSSLRRPRASAEAARCSTSAPVRRSGSQSGLFVMIAIRRLAMEVASVARRRPATRASQRRHRRGGLDGIAARSRVPSAAGPVLADGLGDRRRGLERGERGRELLEGGHLAGVPMSDLPAVQPIDSQEFHHRPAMRDQRRGSRGADLATKHPAPFATEARHQIQRDDDLPPGVAIAAGSRLRFACPPSPVTV